MPIGLARSILTYQSAAGGGFTEARDSAALRTVDLGGTTISSDGGKFSGTSVKSGEGSDKIRVYPVDTAWDFEYNQPWTVEFWFKTSVSSYTPEFNGSLGGLDFGPSGGLSHRLVNGQNGQRISLGSVTVNISHSTSFRHYAFVNNGSGTVKFYLDGSLQATNNSFDLTYGTPTRHQWYYGSTSGNAGQPSYYWDEMRFSNIARYTANFTPHTSPHENDGNTLGLFHFDGNYNDDNNL